MTAAIGSVRALARALLEARQVCSSCLTAECATPSRCLSVAYLAGDP